jgi:integrative and conjugative element protein (TIGR02256 family)
VRFTRPKSGRFEIGDAALVQLTAHRQLAPEDPESGGVLLGRLIENSSDVIVDEISTPKPADRCGRFRFLRRRKPAQRHVDKAWAETSSTRVYLGEWHSHPEDVPTPSGHDLQEWERIVNCAKYEQDSLFFIIVGRLEERVWELTKHTGAPVMLRPEDAQKSLRQRKLRASDDSYR